MFRSRYCEEAEEKNVVYGHDGHAVRTNGDCEGVLEAAIVWEGDRDGDTALERARRQQSTTFTRGKAAAVIAKQK